MMRTKKIITCLIFVIVLYVPPVKAQQLNISGDTIYVNTESEVQIKFPAIPKLFSISPNNALYHSSSVDKGVFIGAKSENARPATLLVSEADRNHSFIILFKKDINYATQLYFDYSTLKKLDQHIKETALQKAKEPVKIAAKVTEMPAAEPVDSSSNYYALLEEGDKNLTQENYAGAKISFDKAHVLRPADAVPLLKLEQIKTKLAEKDKLAQQENDSKYYNVTAQAKIYLDQKKYEEAQQLYKQALGLRPGDLYVTRQLENINKLLLEENGQKEQQKNRDLYNKYIAEGEVAFTKNQFTDARLAYGQALLIKPNDVLATGRLKSVEDKENLQKQSEELENNYNTAIQAADKFFAAGDYANAKTGYTKAIGLIKRPWPQEQLKKIALQENIDKQKMAQQALMEQQQKDKLALESSYDAAIQAADNFFKAGDYDKAETQYVKALDYSKKDWPKEQINTINKIKADQLAQENAEKQRKAQAAEIDLKYTALLKNAESEFDKSNYNKAKTFYTDASRLKPAEQNPKERLLIIENILIKIAADQKAKSDSINLAKELNTKYILALANAKSYYLKNDLLKAKSYYEEAANVKPGEEEPKSQLKIILSKLADIERENEINDRYDSIIALANTRVIAKAYDSAISAYQEALKIKPLESLPLKQIKYIQSEQADIAKQKQTAKRIEDERRYTQAISTANKAVTDKRYEDAQSAFTEALSIHPEDETAKKRLELVSLQVEKAKAEKQAQDAQVKEVPVKKSKRKKSS